MVWSRKPVVCSLGRAGHREVPPYVQAAASHAKCTISVGTAQLSGIKYFRFELLGLFYVTLCENKYIFQSTKNHVLDIGRYPPEGGTSLSPARPRLYKCVKIT